MAETFAPETLLDTAVAAERLGVSPSFLAKARMQGTGPRYRKLGRAVRYAQADLDHWLMACSRTSTVEQPAVMAPVRKPSQQRLNVRPPPSIDMHDQYITSTTVK
jgi:predicted DNA-binding transcriptional regulator AlpA